MKQNRTKKEKGQASVRALSFPDKNAFDPAGKAAQGFVAVFIPSPGRVTGLPTRADGISVTSTMS